jgi:hypothetical protein
MSSVEIRRYELKTSILKEDERRETIKISKFNKVISDVEAELSAKNKKLESVQERAKLSIGVESLQDRLSAFGACVKSLRNLAKEKKTVSDKLSSLNQEKASQVELVLALKNKGEKIAELISDRKALVKQVKEVAAQEEIISTKTAIEINRAEKKEKVGAEVGETWAKSSYEDWQAGLGGSISERGVDISVIGALSAASGLGSFGASASGPERGGDQGQQSQQGKNHNQERVWSDFKSEVRGIETQKFEGGQGVALALTGDSGEELKVRVQRRGEKSVRVEIETNHSTDQRRAWGKKSEISNALKAAGFSVEAVIVGGKK